MPDLFILLSYLILGIFAGFAGGFGLGGGILIVPVLLMLFTYQNFPAEILMHLAVATSLCSVIFTAISAIYSHNRQKNITWDTVRLLAPSITIGALLGAILTNYLSSDILRKIFAIFELLVAYHMGYSKISDAPKFLLQRKYMISAGSVIGLLSSILGVGGGTLAVPFLTWCKIDIKRAIGIACACSLPIACTSVLVMIIIGLNQQTLPAHNIGYVHWPAVLVISMTSILSAPLGAKLTTRLPHHILRKTFAIILALIGLKMLL